MVISPTVSLETIFHIFCFLCYLHKAARCQPPCEAAAFGQEIRKRVFSVYAFDQKR
jgi:hypothetical protein